VAEAAEGLRALTPVALAELPRSFMVLRALREEPPRRQVLPGLLGSARGSLALVWAAVEAEGATARALVTRALVVRVATTVVVEAAAVASVTHRVGPLAGQEPGAT